MTIVILVTLLLAIMVVMTFLLLLSTLPHNILALSASFPLQKIINHHNEWSVVHVPQEYTAFPIPIHQVKLAKNSTECKMEQRYPRPPGISAVSYISNGKTLNATLWLSNPLIQPPSNASAWWRPPYTQIPWYSIRYVMSIHIISAYDIGSLDYAVEIEWRNNTWTKTTYLYSPLLAQKVLNSKLHIPVPLGKKYIDLSFDLGSINYPELYDVLFAAHDEYVKDGKLCRMADVASRVYVPPPKFSITAQPNTVTLRPGNDTNVQLKVTSNIAIKSEVSLLLNNSPKDIQTSIIPNETTLPPNGLVTPSLSIKVLEGARPRVYTLPIVTNFSIPTVAKSVTTTEANTPTIQSAPGSNTVIPLYSNLTLIVKPSYTTPELLNNLVSTWIKPLNALWGFLVGIAVIIGPWIFRRRRKKAA